MRFKIYGYYLMFGLWYFGFKVFGLWFKVRVSVNVKVRVRVTVLDILCFQV